MDVQVDDAHSEMINRRVSCLLRKIELFKGVIILATDFPVVMDNAFQCPKKGTIVLNMGKILENIRIP